MNTKVYNMECVAMSTNVLRAFGYVCSVLITLCMHLCITQQPYLLLTQNFGFGFATCYQLCFVRWSSTFTVNVYNNGVYSSFITSLNHPS